MFARADLRAAAKKGSETIEQTAFGTLKIDYLKQKKLYEITATVGDTSIHLGTLPMKEAEKVVAASYVVLKESS
jgi:hypothetical protein